MVQGLTFFDTTVLVAASVPDHPHHLRSLVRLGELRKGGGACAAHTLAEAYNTLTRTPRGYGLPPFAAAQIVADAGEVFTQVALSAEETVETIRMCAELGLAGPIIFDALLLACARKIAARKIYTHNLKHYRQIAPDLASRIQEP